MKVRLTDVRHGKDKRSNIIYATLIEADTGDLVIAATLEYILNAVKTRGYVLV